MTAHAASQCLAALARKGSCVPHKATRRPLYAASNLGIKSVPFMFSPGTRPIRRNRMDMPEPSRSNTSAAESAW
ncbi:hypothetical protein D3C75_1306680 [compost metagenome]